MVKFKRHTFSKLLVKLQQRPNHSDRVFRRFANSKGLIIHRRHFLHFVQIFQMLNHRHITINQMIPHAKWLRKNKYGRFAMISRDTHLPHLVGMPDTAVKLLYSYHATAYVQFIIASYQEMPFVSQANLPERTSESPGKGIARI